MIPRTWALMNPAPAPASAGPLYAGDLDALARRECDVRVDRQVVDIRAQAGDLLARLRRALCTGWSDRLSRGVHGARVRPAQLGTAGDGVGADRVDEITRPTSSTRVMVPAAGRGDDVVPAGVARLGSVVLPEDRDRRAGIAAGFATIRTRSGQVGWNAVLTSFQPIDASIPCRPSRSMRALAERCSCHASSGCACRSRCAASSSSVGDAAVVRNAWVPGCPAPVNGELSGVNVAHLRSVAASSTSEVRRAHATRRYRVGVGCAFPIRVGDLQDPWTPWFGSALAWRRLASGHVCARGTPPRWRVAAQQAGAVTLTLVSSHKLGRDRR